MVHVVIHQSIPHTRLNQLNPNPHVNTNTHTGGAATNSADGNKSGGGSARK